MAQVQAITAQLKTAPTQPPEQKAAFPPPEQKTAFDKVRFSHITPLSVLPMFIVGSLLQLLWIVRFVCGLSFPPQYQNGFSWLYMSCRLAVNKFTE